jgi:hypothetical protein
LQIAGFGSGFFPQRSFGRSLGFAFGFDLRLALVVFGLSWRRLCSRWRC